VFGVEFGNRRVRLDHERRIELHWARRGRQHDHVGYIGTPEDTRRRDVVGSLGGVVDPEDRNEGTASAFVAKCGEHGVGFFLRHRCRLRRGSCRREAENPAGEARQPGQDDCDTAQMKMDLDMAASPVKALDRPQNSRHLR
jgi:hypothetical protein